MNTPGIFYSAEHVTCICVQQPWPNHSKLNKNITLKNTDLYTRENNNMYAGVHTHTHTVTILI